MLKTKRMSIVPTFVCTLRCRLCSNHMPAFQNPPRASVEEMKADIDALFALFDHIEWLQFVGGEIFTHKHLDEVFDYCKQYDGRFDRLIVETNATVLPTDKELRSLLSYGRKLKVMISDYGDLSKARDRFAAILEENHIEYVLKKYYGDLGDQHFGGWIDNTNPHDLKEPGYVLEANARNCPQSRIKNMHVYDGKLHRCANSCFMLEMGLFPPKEGDFVRLRDNSLTREEKREIISEFYEQARRSCRYCKQKYMDILPRYPAAEQV